MRHRWGMEGQKIGRMNGWGANTARGGSPAWGCTDWHPWCLTQQPGQLYMGISLGFADPLKAFGQGKELHEILVHHSLRGGSASFTQLLILREPNLVILRCSSGHRGSAGAHPALLPARCGRSAQDLPPCHLHEVPLGGFGVIRTRTAQTSNSKAGKTPCYCTLAELHAC